MTGKSAVIIGSGIAAAIVAKFGLENNIFSDVVMLEAGPPIKRADRRAWLDYLATGVTPYSSCVDDEKLEVEGLSERFLLSGGRLLARGGSTVHWGGWALRFMPEDFALKTMARHAIDWPFGYDDLEPFYAMAEDFIGVAGDSEEAYPPRKGKGYTIPKVPFAQMDGPVIKTLKDMRISFGHLPIARNYNCATTGTCKYCPRGGRYSADMSLDELSATFPTRFSLLTRSPAVRILMETAQRAYGVEYINTSTGSVERVLAELVIVCAGAIESPKLLLASADSRWWPEGLGNKTGHVGRHLVSHSRIEVKGVLPSNGDRMHQELDFPTLCSRHFDSQAEQSSGKMFFIRDDRESAISIEKLMSQKHSKVSAIDKAFSDSVTISLHGFVEEFETPENAVSLAHGRNRFGLPRTKIVYRTHDDTSNAKSKNAQRLSEILARMGCEVKSVNLPNPRSDHAVSTCRMSKTEADGVVDPNLRVHGTENVFVCSNAVFPNVAAVNPTLTLAALAIRFATGSSF